MSDYNTPTTTTQYITVLQALKDRDVDAVTLQSAAITNPPTGAFKYNRATDGFEEYNGSAYVAKVLSLVAGGTGANTAAGARTSLGLGTMATQNNNSVNITGGNIAGNIDASSVNSGTLSQARLGSGSGGAGTKALFDDQTYKAIAAESKWTVAAVQSANFTAAITEKPTLYPLTGSHTVTLPTVVANAGARICFVNRSTGSWTFSCHAGETILGAATYSFNFGQYSSLVLIADANNNLWDIL